MSRRNVARHLLCCLLLAMSYLLSGCDNYDDQRLPTRPVHIEIYAAQWSVYGVHGYMEWQTFVKNSLPKGFSWPANSYSGFGGVLLIGGLNNQLLAYDMACPIECKSNVQVTIDEEAGRSRVQGLRLDLRRIQRLRTTPLGPRPGKEIRSHLLPGNLHLDRLSHHPIRTPQKRKGTDISRCLSFL